MLMNLKIALKKLPHLSGATQLTSKYFRWAYVARNYSFDTIYCLLFSFILRRAEINKACTEIYLYSLSSINVERAYEVEMIL